MKIHQRGCHGAAGSALPAPNTRERREFGGVCFTRPGWLTNDVVEPDGPGALRWVGETGFVAPITRPDGHAPLATGIGLFGQVRSMAPADQACNIRAE